MKRRTHPQQKSGKSPWQKYKKKAYVYSEKYRRWKADNKA